MDSCRFRAFTPTINSYRGGGGGGIAGGEVRDIAIEIGDNQPLKR